jgi:hypothetical protein
MCGAKPPLPSRLPLSAQDIITSSCLSSWDSNVRNRSIFTSKVFSRFFCGLFHKAVHTPDYPTSNGITTREWRSGRDFKVVVTQSKHQLGICLKGLRVTMKNISQSTRWPGLHFTQSRTSSLHQLVRFSVSFRTFINSTYTHTHIQIRYNRANQLYWY